MILSLLIGLAAAASPYCIDLPKVDAAVRSCQQNIAYVQAADRCLKRLEREVDARTSALAGSISVRGATAAGAQSAQLANATANAADSGISLETLRESAKELRRELALYDQDLTWPGNVKSRQVLTFHAEFREFLAKFPCYRDPHATLEADLARVDKKIEDLARAGASVAGVGAFTRASSQHLDSGATGTAHGRGKGGGSSAQAPASGGSSTITGEIREEK